MHYSMICLQGKGEKIKLYACTFTVISDLQGPENWSGFRRYFLFSGTTMTAETRDEQAFFQAFSNAYNNI